MTKPIQRARAARRRLAEAAMRRAVMPDTPTLEATADKLARVEALSRAARAMWLGLLAYLAFVVLTLFSVRDVDFFSLERSVTLPLVNVAIPTETFFLGAPVLGAALHVYLHLHLLKLWDVLAELPARDTEDHPIGDRIFPWLLSDWALRRRQDHAQATTPRPMDWSVDWVTFVLAWLAAPIALAFFWLRSKPAHEEGLTLTIALTLLVASVASWRSYTYARAKLRKRDQRPDAPVWRRMVYGVAAVSLAVVSWARTEGGLDYYGFEWPTLADLSITDEDGTVFWTPLAPINLRDADLARQPADWVSHETARNAFRANWCRQHGLFPTACHPPNRGDFDGNEDAFTAEQSAHRAARKRWCNDTRRAPDACDMALDALESRFEAEWAERRQSYLATLSKPDMQARDLRGADANGAFMVGLDLRNARLEGADLSEALLEGANLFEARLDRVNLFEARLEGASLNSVELEGLNLRDAWLSGADLSGTRLEEMNLSGARLERADLSEAVLVGVDLIGAQLEKADLSKAVLEGADLSRARLEAAILSEAVLNGAILSGARLEKTILSRAVLEGAVLIEARLEGADLREARLQEATLRWARLESTDLHRARLERAYLGGARLVGADLSEARLERAILRGARLEGADLSEAQAQSVNWAGATFGASPAHSADFTGGRNLTQRQLDLVIGDDTTILPPGLHVWSCWETPPPNLDAMLERAAYPFSTIEDLRAQWLCSDTNPRVRTGTPAPE